MNRSDSIVKVDNSAPEFGPLHLSTLPVPIEHEADGFPLGRQRPRSHNPGAARIQGEEEGTRWIMTVLTVSAHSRRPGPT
jgi:hypothetical protein